MGLFQKLFKGKIEEKANIPNSFGYDVVLDGFNSNYETQYDDNKLINEGYTHNTDVYAVVKKIADKASDVPFVVKEWNGEEWILNTDSALNDLIRRPNDNLSEKEWRFNSLIYLLNTGDSLWRKTTGAFDLVTELDVLPSNLTSVLTDYNNNLVGYCFDNLNGTETKLTIDEVTHTKYFNPSIRGLESYRGLSPLQAAYNSLKASNNRLTAQAHLYENRGATNLISTNSDVTLMPLEQEQIQKETDNILGGAKNFNKSIVSTKNLKVTPLGMSATDLKLIEAKDLDLRDICNAFGVPSTLFNDQAASTLDNLKIGTRLMYTDSIIPTNEKLLSDFNKDVTPSYSAYEGKELRVFQDTTGIDVLQDDQLTKVEKQSKEVDTILSISDNQSLAPKQKENLLNYLGMIMWSQKNTYKMKGLGLVIVRYRCNL